MANLSLGNLVMTSALSDLIATNEAFSRFVTNSFIRYMNKDWGDLSDDDRDNNDQAVVSGDERIHAAYLFPKDALWDATNDYGIKENKIWIITERDHSVTTILFPGEY